jgi:hypothetical protein
MQRAVNTKLAIRASGVEIRNNPAQHPPTQWNLRGGKWSSFEKRSYKPKNPSLKKCSFFFLYGCTVSQYKV